MTHQRVYLDYAATTPLDPGVLEKMLPYFSEKFGNPSSIHSWGQQAEAALENAREQVAGLLGCSPKEVIFTSCGSESDNLAVRGAAMRASQQRGARHILYSPVEHHAVSRTVEQLVKLHGFEGETLPVDPYGLIAPEELARRIRPDTALVSIIYANNEIGSTNPVQELARVCRSAGVPFHTDAVQAASYLSTNVQELEVDLMSLGAHKFYGPKGVGVLYVRSGTPLIPLQTGGSQEFGLRAGTQNIPYIIGFAAALELAVTRRENRTRQVLPLRDRLVGQVLEAIPDAALTGHASKRLPNHASFVFKNVDGNALLMHLDLAGFACSSGSACKTGSPEPSDVLTAIGLERDWALGSLRVTLGKDSTPEEVEAFTQALPALVAKLR